VSITQRLPAIVSLDATRINYDRVGRHYGHRPAGDGLVDRQVYRLNRRAFHAAAGLVARSERARDSLVCDYGVDRGRIQVLAPGAAPPYFAIGARLVAGGTPRAQESERVRALFVGGDFERQGGSLLLERRQDPSARAASCTR